MDVTSLLNSSSAALQRRDSVDSSTPSATGGTTAASTAVPTPSPERTPSRRTSGSRSPNRNRTPWDAGGYSLPLSLDTKGLQTPSTARPVFYCESPTDGHSSSSPKSPKHKFSDSRSSLSSYASSNNSVSHSRISSLSTVSEFQPLTNLITEITLNSRMPVEKPDHSASRHPGSSPARSPPSSVHSIPAEERPVAPIYTQRSFSGPYTDDISPTQTAPPHRPGSPSDAVFIRRGQGITGSPSYIQEEQPNLSTSSLSPENPLSRAHKRAVSAPDFPALTTVEHTTSANMPRSQRRQPARNGIDSSEENYDRPAARNMHPRPTLSSDPEVDSDSEQIRVRKTDKDDDDQVPKCQYIGNCNTGSSLRKVISHIFGRNKLCTRVVPEHVWVHVCRKHYQRARYRNAVEYAKMQCDLVRQQIHRVQEWSDKNKEQGNPDVMRDWTFAMRKREAERVTKAKRKRQADDEEDDGFGVNENESAIAQGRAVPNWLTSKLGSGYTSPQILEILTEIEQALEENRLISIPDIEFLPNLIKDESKAKAANKRKVTTTRAHARSRSMGVHQNTRDDEDYPSGRRVSQPNTNGYWDRNDAYNTPAEKRQRVGVSEDYYEERHALPSMPPRSMERIVPTMRPFQSSRRTSGFGDIRESQAEDRYNTSRHTPPGNSSFGYGMMSGSSGPLPAPTPSNNSGPLGPPLPETPQSNMYTRPTHQRSHSEVGSMTHGPQTPYRQAPSVYNVTPGPDYTLPSQSYQANSGMYVNETPNYRHTGYTTADSSSNAGTPYENSFRQQSSFTPQPLYNYQTPATGSSFGGPAKHMRHQSTPIAPRSLGSDGHIFPTPTSINRYDTPPGQYLPARPVANTSYSSATLPSISRVEEMDNGNMLRDPASIGGVTGLTMRR